MEKPQATHSLLKGATLWMTGLSKSGKTTLSNGLKHILQDLLADTTKVKILDGETLREGLNSDLGFSPKDTAEHFRRVGEVAKIFAQTGQLCIVDLISPLQEHRDGARTMHLKDGVPFIECFVDAPLQICEDRDEEGIYKLAKQGSLKGLPGVTDKYIPPKNPEVVLMTSKMTVEHCLKLLQEKLE